MNTSFTELWRLHGASVAIIRGWWVGGRGGKSRNTKYEDTLTRNHFHIFNLKETMKSTSVKYDVMREETEVMDPE